MLNGFECITADQLVLKQLSTWQQVRTISLLNTPVYLASGQNQHLLNPHVYLATDQKQLLLNPPVHLEAG